MINFDEKILISLAEKSYINRQVEDAWNLVKKLANKEEHKLLKSNIAYLYAKKSFTKENIQLCLDLLKECNQFENHKTLSLIQDKRHLLNQILCGTTPSVFESTLTENLNVKEVVKLHSDQFRPYIWYVGCAAAYRSGYDHEVNDHLSRLIRQSKIKVRIETLDKLGAFLAEFLFYKTPILERADIIVPVPTDILRWDKRGYSIPLALAKAISTRCALPLLDLIELDQNAPELRGLSRAARAQAVRDLYSTDKVEWIKSHSILIVDDVITSGSTVNAIAESLLMAGAKEVSAIAIAHTEHS